MVNKFFAQNLRTFVMINLNVITEAYSKIRSVIVIMDIRVKDVKNMCDYIIK